MLYLLLHVLDIFNIIIVTGYSLMYVMVFSSTIAGTQTSLMHPTLQRVWLTGPGTCMWGWMCLGEGASGSGVLTLLR